MFRCRRQIWNGINMIFAGNKKHIKCDIPNSWNSIFLLEII